LNGGADRAQHECQRFGGIVASFGVAVIDVANTNEDWNLWGGWHIPLLCLIFPWRESVEDRKGTKELTSRRDEPSDQEQEQDQCRNPCASSGFCT
jgi:hypothetical protein